MIFSKKQYFTLCKSCDEILNENPEIELISISWLHIIREHPVFLNQYKSLFSKNKGKFYNFGIRFFKILNYNIKILLHLFRSLISRKKFYFQSRQFSKKVDFFFISHFVKISDAGSDYDFYFDRIICDLTDKGYNVVVGIVNHTRLNEKELSLKWEKSNTPRLVFSKRLDFWTELKFYISLLKQSLKLSRKSKIYSIDYFKSNLYKFAAVEAFAGNTFSTLRLYYQVYEFIKKHQPKYLVTTHEGHAWERLSFLAARNAYPNIICKAYQHAAIFKFQHSLCRNLSKNLNPDQILVPGQNSFNRINKEVGLNGVSIKIMGSNRGSNGSSSKLIPQILDNGNGYFKILVVPEGIIEECIILFNYSISQAVQNPDIEFVWRLHPLINRVDFIKKNKKFKKLPLNIRWSMEGENISDFSYTHVLYRGSTLVIQAVLNGVQPIYLNRESEMTIDVLYAINEFKIIANDDTKLKIEILKEINQDFQVIQHNYSKLKDFCLNYYFPFDTNVLI